MPPSNHNFIVLCTPEQSRTITATLRLLKNAEHITSDTDAIVRMAELAAEYLQMKMLAAERLRELSKPQMSSKKKRVLYKHIVQTPLQ